ncbi:carboxymuconolactone decarboxylase family protein [Nonomuraea sp. NPDC002799]
MLRHQDAVLRRQVPRARYAPDGRLWSAALQCLAHPLAAFGDMYARPELPTRDRQLVTLSVLTALGGCEIELEVHVNAALYVGLAPAEISEALLHSAVYCGIPRAINATLVAKKVFAERGLLPITNAG